MTWSSSTLLTSSNLDGRILVVTLNVTLAGAISHGSDVVAVAATFRMVDFSGDASVLGSEAGTFSQAYRTEQQLRPHIPDDLAEKVAVSQEFGTIAELWSAVRGMREGLGCTDVWLAGHALFRRTVHAAHLRVGLDFGACMEGVG